MDGKANSDLEEDRWEANPETGSHPYGDEEDEVDTDDWDEEGNDDDDFLDEESCLSTSTLSNVEDVADVEEGSGDEEGTSEGGGHGSSSSSSSEEHEDDDGGDAAATAEPVAASATLASVSSVPCPLESDKASASESASAAVLAGAARMWAGTPSAFAAGSAFGQQAGPSSLRAFAPATSGPEAKSVATLSEVKVAPSHVLASVPAGSSATIPPASVVRRSEERAVSAASLQFGDFKRSFGQSLRRARRAAEEADEVKMALARYELVLPTDRYDEKIERALYGS